MLILYYRPSCPYCQNVLSAAEALQVSFDLRDISSPEIANELVSKGGKRQVPYLVDGERGNALYESYAIIAYLTEHYGRRAPGIRIHRGGTTGGGGNVCT